MKYTSPDLAAYRAAQCRFCALVFRALVAAMSQKWKKRPPTTLTLPDVVAWLRTRSVITSAEPEIENA
uniref:hypothetical protein n=1 Tax=Salmonella sp. TaxID=599 RepID=UPI001CD95E3A|nr:hypothetical protein [Salmonella sp.]